MNSKWKTKKLVDICSLFTDGDWIERKDQAQMGIRLIQTSNIGKGYFKNNENKARFITDYTFKKLHCKEIFMGDCLISRLPDPIGRSCILTKKDERMITAVDCTIARFDLKQIIPEFFIYYSNSHDYLSSVSQESSGATRKRISRNRLGNINIPVPPLPEQQRIINILDKAFKNIETAKANAEKNLQNTHAIFENYLQSIMTKKRQEWNKKKLIEIIKRTETFNPRKYPNFEFNYIDISSVSNITYQIEETHKIKGKDAPSRARQIVKVNDILFATVRPTLRRVVIVPKHFDGQMCSTGYCVLRSKPEVDHRFLFYSLIEKNFINTMEILQKGTSYPAVTNNEIKAQEIFFPTLSEQQRIISILDTLYTETKNLEFFYKQKIELCDALKKSFLHQAFNGEL